MAASAAGKAWRRQNAGRKAEQAGQTPVDGDQFLAWEEIPRRLAVRGQTGSEIRLACCHWAAAMTAGCREALAALRAATAEVAALTAVVAASAAAVAARMARTAAFNFSASEFIALKGSKRDAKIFSGQTLQNHFRFLICISSANSYDSETLCTTLLFQVFNNLSIPVFEINLGLTCLRR
jgi:hypothetical protein